MKNRLLTTALAGAMLLSGHAVAHAGGSTTANGPVSVPPNVLGAINYRIRLLGPRFEALLQDNAAARASLAVAVAAQLGGEVDLDSLYIAVTMLTMYGDL